MQEIRIRESLKNSKVEYIKKRKDGLKAKIENMKAKRAQKENTK